MRGAYVWSLARGWRLWVERVPTRYPLRRFYGGLLDQPDDRRELTGTLNQQAQGVSFSGSAAKCLSEMIICRSLPPKLSNPWCL
jgi:hypothetical protein